MTVHPLINKTGQPIPNAFSVLDWDQVLENNQYIVQLVEKLCPRPMRHTKTYSFRDKVY